MNITNKNKEIIEQHFDKIIKGLASQNWQLSLYENCCVFISNDNCRCPIGWLIPDEFIEQAKITITMIGLFMLCGDKLYQHLFKDSDNVVELKLLLIELLLAHDRCLPLQQQGASQKEISNKLINNLYKFSIKYNIKIGTKI